MCVEHKTDRQTFGHVWRDIVLMNVTDTGQILDGFSCKNSEERVKSRKNVSFWGL